MPLSGGIWADMLNMGVPLVEKVLRTALVYLFLIFCLRLAGKRELAQLNPFDLVVLLLLSNTVQNAIIGNDDSLVGGLVGAGTLLLLNYGAVRFLYRHPQLDRMIEGEPTTLIEGGTIDEANLARELITRAELESAARKQGFASLQEIERAVLEPGGSITFVGRKPSDAMRLEQILARLDAIAAELAALRAAPKGGASS
jgi:uncharacterized membrane protein YcaP (DUF421 family)